MECFAEGLGLPFDTFTAGTVDPGVGDSQSVLRLLHYHSTEGKSFGDNFWRAGAHADFDVLTMVSVETGPKTTLTISCFKRTAKAASKSVPAERS